MGGGDHRAAGIGDRDRGGARAGVDAELRDQCGVLWLDGVVGDAVAVFVGAAGGGGRGGVGGGIRSGAAGGAAGYRRWGEDGVSCGEWFRTEGAAHGSRGTEGKAEPIRMLE